MWKHKLLSKWLIIVSAALFSTLVLVSYALQSTTISLEVKEPLEILSYPSSLSVYPGQKVDFTVSLRNVAPVPYNVSLDFGLNDTAYQISCVTFSNDIYTVPPGETS
jgi:hypothetical protein